MKALIFLNGLARRGLASALIMLNAGKLPAL